MAEPGSIIGSSLSTLVKEYSTISHNLANINTVGFKRKINSFQRELMRHMRNENDPATGGALNMKGHFDFTQGSFLHTGNSLDAAICGRGFFVVETPDGPRYTRNGVFHISPDTRQLVDLSGRILAGAEAPIIIPAGVGEQEINIAEDGSVTARGVQLGRIRLVEFDIEDEEKVKPIGDNLYMAPKDVAAQPSQCRLRQGFRENSNVNLMEELVNMMSVQRMYEMNMNIMKRMREQSSAMIDVAKSG